MIVVAINVCDGYLLGGEHLALPAPVLVSCATLITTHWNSTVGTQNMVISKLKLSEISISYHKLMNLFMSNKVLFLADSDSQ